MSIRKFLNTLVLAVVLAVFATLPVTHSAHAVGNAKDVSILVLPFELNADPELAYLKEGLPQLLADKLEAEGFSVVPVAEMEKLLKEQEVEFLDLQTSRDLALLAKANYVVYGSFSQVGDTLSIDARLLDSFGLKPVVPLFVTKKGLINVLPAVEELAGKVQLELLRKEQIAEIDVEGNKIIDKEVVLFRLRSQKGEVYDPSKVNKDLKRLYELGYFDDVAVRVEDVPQGKRLVFTVKEKPRIQAVSIIGNENLDEDDLVELMDTKVGGVLNLKVLSDDLNKIREQYRKDGYYLADVTYEVKDAGTGQARLELKVAEGNKLYISGIRIEGAEQLDEDDLKDELALAERGIFSWITDSGVLKEELLDRDSAALEAYYGNRGFIKAKVSQPEVEFKEDGIYITFHVQEGPRYKIGKITFSGDLLESDAVLLERIRMDDLAEDDEYFDRSVLRQDLKRLTDYYTNYGYAFAEADVDMAPNDETLVVDLNYSLRKNRKVFIRRVVVEGNSKTRDNVILREVRLGDGDLFNGNKIGRSSERLMKLDFFKNVDIEPVPTGDPSQMDLKVKVSEKPTGSLSAGVGYSSIENVYVGGKVQERNLFGRGYNLALSASFGSKTTQFNLAFTNPHYDNTKLSVGGDAYVVKEDWDTYEKSTAGGRVRFGYPLGEYTKAFWSYKLERYDIYDIDENDASDTVKDFEGENYASTIETSIVRDTTDRPFLPTKGTVNRLAFDYSGGPIGGNEDYVKFVYGTNYFKTLWWEHVFHFRAEAGYVFENYTAEDIPPWERFYLGGINDVRGYKGNDISPRDEGDSDDTIGGNKEFFVNFEYLFPLVKEMNLIGLAFFDMGNAWDDDQSFFDDKAHDGGSSIPLGLYKSVGLGVRWNSPLGPLRLEYGYPLDELEGSSDNGKLEFSIGTAF